MLQLTVIKCNKLYIIRLQKSWYTFSFMETVLLYKSFQRYTYFWKQKLLQIRCWEHHLELELGFAIPNFILLLEPRSLISLCWTRPLMASFHLWSLIQAAFLAFHKCIYTCFLYLESFNLLPAWLSLVLFCFSHCFSVQVLCSQMMSLFHPHFSDSCCILDNKFVIAINENVV